MSEPDPPSQAQSASDILALISVQHKRRQKALTMQQRKAAELASERNKCAPKPLKEKHHSLSSRSFRRHSMSSIPRSNYSGHSVSSLYSSIEIPPSKSAKKQPKSNNEDNNRLLRRRAQMEQVKKRIASYLQGANDEKYGIDSNSKEQVYNVLGNKAADEDPSDTPLSHTRCLQDTQR
eukprot:Tbor_TRINITY_DN10395_c0_g1::TRINITY_DN10395_c0_g1_i1::g.15966::m.15966